jgi:PhnB protein
MLSTATPSRRARSIQAPGEVVHGDRMATVIDPFGNQWTVASRIEQISVKELHRRLANA